MASSSTSSKASKPTSSDLVLGSASVGGTMIAVAATSSPGTLLHTVPSTGHEYQRIRVLACNIDSSNRTLTLEYGGTATKDTIVITMGPRRGLIAVIPDMKLAPGYSVRAFASSASVINCYVGTGHLSKEP